MQQSDQRRAKWILLSQIIVTLVVALAALAAEKNAALSALLGGTIATLGNLLFALWVFGPYRAQEPGGLLTRFYGAELLKLLLIALLFAATFVWVEPLNVVALFVAFFLVQVLSPLFAHRFGN